MANKLGEKSTEQMSKSIPVPSEFVSCSSEASALPWSFHLNGREQEEEEQGG